MRWIVLLHLWLSAVLSIQQPYVLVRAERGEARTADARGAPSTPWSEDEDEVPALRSGTPQDLRASHEAPHEPLVSRPGVRVEWDREQRAPDGCDTARCHWRAVQLPPLGPLEGEPPERV